MFVGCHTTRSRARSSLTPLPPSRARHRALGVLGERCAAVVRHLGALNDDLLLRCRPFPLHSRWRQPYLIRRRQTLDQLVENEVPFGSR